jgi:biotin operon repressor
MLSRSGQGRQRVSKRDRRNPKFVWQSAFIKARLTGNTGFVGLLMSTIDNGDGKGFFISYAKISELTGLNERTVRDHVDRLRDLGWIVQTSRGGNRGGRALASTYALVIPEQPQLGATPPQPERSGSQQGAGTLTVDQATLDPSSLDPSTLKDGDELPEQVVSALGPEYRRRFVPSFYKDAVMVYLAPTPHTPPAATAARPVDTRPEWKRRQTHERMLRDEGLDEYGEPLRRRPRP